MFETLKELVNQLDETNLKTYKNGVKARTILQKIKNEAQKLRFQIVELREIKHKVTKEEIKENNLEGIVEENEEIGIPEPTLEEETFEEDKF